MGVTTELDVVPSIGLGTSPVTLLEMVSAYATIANDGLQRAPRLVTRIETASGTVLETFGGGGNQALTRRDARQLLDMLRGVVDRGTGRDLRTMGATGDLAGKTGTTQRYADGWFVAMRPGLAVGAWVGFNDQRVTWRSKQTGEGSKTSLPVVGDFLVRVQDGLPDVSFRRRRAATTTSRSSETSTATRRSSRTPTSPTSRPTTRVELRRGPVRPAPIDAPDVERPDRRPPRAEGAAACDAPHRVGPRPGRVEPSPTPRTPTPPGTTPPSATETPPAAHASDTAPCAPQPEQPRRDDGRGDHRARQA